MTAKTSAARVAAFLKAVAETGNQTIAAERAKVSLSWVTTHRKRDAAFDQAVREAVATARAALLAGPGTRDAALRGMRPRAGWGSIGGEELVVRGIGAKVARDSPDTERGGRPRGRVQIARARVKQWTPRTEAAFLRALGETANAKAACAAVGLSYASAYAHRYRWPDFARRWHAVLEEAMTRLEMALLERGANPLSDPEIPDAGPIREMTASEALYMLTLFKRQQAPARALEDEAAGAALRERILERIGRIKAWKARQAEEGAGGETAG